ncbi:MAG: pyridoxal-phosphate dependent enzyme [Chloroflexi bacterium]|nr:pyridoxal-phosphate dependent enzyme [Chloroflexota bacterium]MDE2649097.1 pyridoxal-phosphate dependent enzyme [Chloroflexota bacterium]MXX82198.1 pyridoxal-phosphate dependent enzyme [Chloroflexota bacterium]MYA92111.1 pyridoxal-phosphate dependent enzyme [Chloroflexota bacterium]MYC55134.1 pyridoxal-phosphate dependent enzyme [Chloroflexota bacterium]
MARIRCATCGRTAQPTDWRCEDCGGLLDWVALPSFAPARIVQDDFSLWRYRDLLPVQRRFSLGEGLTPLVPLNWGGARFFAKLEYLNPTGSFKDRGVAVMLNHLAGAGVASAMDNSSGNAGASLAAYAALAGMKATVYVPKASAVASKKAHIRAYGGEIIESAHLPAEIYAAARSRVYASHAWNPSFVLGQQTAAWEIWEQLGRRAPTAVAAPVGHGGLFLGMFRGFLALRKAGLLERIPRMIAVQSAGVDPIVRAWEAGADTAANITRGNSVADGILVDEPVRGRQILRAIADSHGLALRVDNDAILAAQQRLHARGFMVEATSAVPVAALSQIRARLDDASELVIALTGSGLKNLAG